MDSMMELSRHERGADSPENKKRLGIVIVWGMVPPIEIDARRQRLRVDTGCVPLTEASFRTF